MSLKKARNTSLPQHQFENLLCQKKNEISADARREEYGRSEMLGTDVTEKGPMKAFEVTLVKKKRKKIDGGSAVYSTVAGLQSTTTVILTTEIIEDDDSADATIMKNHFKPAPQNAQMGADVDQQFNMIPIVKHY
ncbi:unnamed protein product [Cylicocyclus nassatus]|uniref:Uncharacterized protein n=1 Tax=Cylicocyclus nassatus TaxID=53992 RepID=A0AA36H1S1_CYLNA|nr:unnamed protein product [Cylicocyclus nassatus]